MRRAFTLIEILVVVAIIGVLAALAIPLISVTKGRADAANCLNRLRVLGVSLNLYVSEHEMKLPLLKAARSSRSEEEPVIDNTINQYVDNTEVFRCPADSHIAEESGTSYYWNSALSGQPLASLNFLGLPELSKIPVLMDKEGWHKYSQHKVNYLFADGHATQELRLFTE
jgi:prepilin-type N-terminal cleavage/methylation domain-containing protein/prepilin-type processing-associated H-X9-DG protein